MDPQNPAPGLGASTIGSAAPSLESVRWIMGDSFSPGAGIMPFAVEFWSVWSGENSDILSRLSQEFPGLKFVSVAVGSTEESVRAYLQELGEPVLHSVGVDDAGSSAATPETQRGGPIARDWLEAFGERGLPITFLVDGSRNVRWIGHARELPRVLAEFLTGKLSRDATSHRRRQVLQALEQNPDTTVDESIFTPIFALRPPEVASGTIEWLAPPAPQSANPEPQAQTAAKSGGFLGRVFGRSKAEPAPGAAEAAKPAVTNRFGAPRPGHALALVLTDVVTDRSLEPGWNVLNEPELNDLPNEFPEVDFAVLVRTAEPLGSVFDPEYADALARWTGEIGWRLGSENVGGTAAADGSASKAPTSGIFDFYADRVHLILKPAAVLIDPSGTLIWAGSPLRLHHAIESWKSGELTPEESSADLVFWYRLLVSNAANERLAGITGSRQSGGPGWQGFPADTFESESWAQIIDQLKTQLPWRAHLWTVFEFSMATRVARKSGEGEASARSIQRKFEELSSRFESEFQAMDLERIADYDYDPLEPWRLTVLTAIEYLGLLSEGVEPLEGAELFAIEAHPLTQAIMESAERLDECLNNVPTATLYQPSVLPVLMLRLGHKTEAKQGFDAEEQRFERFLEAVRESGQEDAIEQLLGADVESFRAVITNLKALCG
jgi:hypothetical protein